MSALFFSKAAYKIYYYQVRWDKGNEQGFFGRVKSLVSDFSNKSSIRYSVSVNPNFLARL